MKRWFGAMALMVVAGAGCDSGSPTGAVCDESLELTWDTFGKDFMDAYCVRCHESFANQSTIQSRKSAIDEEAGSGPDATNTLMPESGLKPSKEERALLSTWLACGAP